MSIERVNHEHEREEKRAQCERLCKGVPEAVFVLSGGIKQVSRGGEPVFASNAYGDADPHGLLAGSKGRVMATVELADVFPDAQIVTNSMFPTDEPEAPSHAAVMAEEMQRHGIASDRIVRQEESMSTLTELQALVRMIVERQWKQIAVVTNGYHIPRCEEILRQLLHPESVKLYTQSTSFSKALEQFHASEQWVLQTIAETRPSIVFVSAEDVLPIRDDHYRALVARVTVTEAYQKRVAVETQAVLDLQQGLYGLPERRPKSDVEL